MSKVLIQEKKTSTYLHLLHLEFSHAFCETLFDSYLSQKSSCAFVFGNERRITISLAQIILIVTETYLYETFFSGKFTDFVVYTLTGAQMYQQVERETRRKETTDKNTDIYSN